MKFTCLTEILSQKLAAVSHAVSGRASLPVLSHVFLEAALAGESGCLTLSATNLEISIKTTFPVKVEAEGSACLPGRVFLELVSNLPKGTVELTEKNNIVAVKTEKTSSKINGIGVAEFPKIITEGETLFSLPAGPFAQSLQKVAFCAAADESRPILTGILMETKDENLVLVGVDGFRLAEKKLAKPFAGSFKETIPVKALLEVARLTGSAETLTVARVGAENQIVFKTADFEIATRLLEGTFPDYQKIIPQNHVSKAEVLVSEFKEAIKVVSVFARDDSSVVKINLRPENSQMILSATTAEVGENQAEVFAKIEGEAAEVAFNAKYLNEALANIGSVDLEFRVTGALNPGVFVPVGDPSYLHLIMPVRIQD